MVAEVSGHVLRHLECRLDSQGIVLTANAPGVGSYVNNLRCAVLYHKRQKVLGNKEGSLYRVG